MFKLVTAVAALAATVSAHGDHEHDQEPIAGPHQGLWYNSLPGDGGKQADSIFSGISTFGRLDYHPCLASDQVKYDIAFIGKQSNCIPHHPLQILTPTRRPIRHRHFLPPRCPLRSKRYQTRFSPSQSLVCKRSQADACTNKGSRKVRFSGGYNVPLAANPFNSWAKVIDCGDIPVTS